MASKPVSETPETPEAQENQSEWVIDVSDIRTMKPIFEWNRIMASQNMDAARQAMMARIKQWPFEGDPSQVVSWENMTPKQWQETLKVCGETVGSVFQNTGN